MPIESQVIPRGPSAAYPNEQDLLTWLGEHCRQYGDIFQASIHGANVYVINSPEYAERVLLKNWQNYPKGRAIKRIGLLLGNGLMVSEGELWTRQRRMIQPAFSRAHLGDLVGVVAAANVDLLRKWTAAAGSASKINLTRDVSAMVLDVLLKSIFGADDSAIAPRFREVLEHTTRDLEFALAFKSLGSLIIALAKRRREANRTDNDFLGMLMQARDRDNGAGMSDSLLAKEVMTLLIAGHETTASTLNWLWYLLAHNHAVEVRLSKELDELASNEIPSLRSLPDFKYTRRVIEETLRLFPPGWLMTRRALRDDHLGNYFVPAGTEIYLSSYHLQRHPAHWQDPAVFNPDRFDSQDTHDLAALCMLPFSAGPRNCIGEHFARTEMQIHLMMISKKLRLRHLESQPPSLAAGVNLLSATDFMMIPEVKQS